MKTALASALASTQTCSRFEADSALALPSPRRGGEREQEQKAEQERKQEQEQNCSVLVPRGALSQQTTHSVTESEPLTQPIALAVDAELVAWAREVEAICPTLVGRMKPDFVGTPVSGPPRLWLMERGRKPVEVALP